MAGKFENPSYRNKIQPAGDTADVINTIFERGQRGRIFNPHVEEYAVAGLMGRVVRWQDEGRIVVLSFGRYDAPFHANHQRFLLDCKLQGVAKYYTMLADEHGGEPWDSLDDVSKQEFSEAALADGAVKLVVSIDGDESGYALKDFSGPADDNQRPLFDWRTRAENVLGLSLDVGIRQGFRAPVVDAVTAHDRFVLGGAIRTGMIEMAASLEPDVLVLYHEATRDIEAASQDSRLLYTEIVVVADTSGYTVSDPRTGQPFSTTDLVRRVKGV